MYPNPKALRPTKDGFGKGVEEISAINETVLVLGADITASVGLNHVRDRFPHRFFSFGIAEQNIASVAAGLALEGFLPVFSTYATFLTTRSLDQLRVSVAYNGLTVLLGGAHAGISVGPDGATHQALEDIAIMRSLPNTTVISPCDATQTEIAVKNAVKSTKGLIYIRFGREAVPDFTDEFQNFTVGKIQKIKDGSDVTIIATGHMVWESLKAAQMLEEQMISCEVLNCHTIKPIDKESIINSAQKTKLVVTVEEHQILGGLGSAICEILSQYCPCKTLMIGIDDSFGESGIPTELFRHFSIDAESIFIKIKQIVKP
ncbi:MAG TPA: transketolase C-terminal domain-containing protein [Salinivirgaceae bacterium]|nr:transketolase C-terminal domain-containing protein [Salinivirgaceae bacterium]